MDTKEKKNILRMIQYALLMLIAAALVIGASVFRESKVAVREERTVLEMREAKRINRTQLYERQGNSVIFDGEEIHIGGR